MKWFFSPSCSNKMSSCSCDWNDNIKVSHGDRYFWNSASFLAFFLSFLSLSSSLCFENLIPLHIQLPTPNFQLLWWGRLLPRCPLLGPINLWWKQWLITREQEKIRPLRYWWFIIHFWGVNGGPYLSCQCLIYTFCSCTKSPAVFSVRGGVLMEGMERQVRLGQLPRTRLCFWVFLALWSDLDIQRVDNYFTLNLSFHLSPLVSPWVLYFCFSIFLLCSVSLSVCVWFAVPLSASLSFHLFLLFTGLLKEYSTKILSVNIKRSSLALSL